MAIPSITRVCEKCGYEVDVAVVFHVCIKPKTTERKPSTRVYPTARHGTRACYQNGCRQAECVEANYAYLKAHREQRRAAGLRSRYDRWDRAS
jgi:hypothetical protein